jgi:hypothetical protein
MLFSRTELAFMRFVETFATVDSSLRFIGNTLDSAVEFAKPGTCGDACGGRKDV